MTDTINVPGTLAGDYAIHMQSDAMAPGILKGDLLVVRKADRADAGQIVVAKVDGEATVRTYRLDQAGKGQVRLEADNPTVEDIVAPAADVLVMGIVTGLIRGL